VSEHLDLSDPVVGALIRRMARKLARRKLDTAADQDDIAQNLAVALLSRGAKFDASRGELGAFLHTLLTHAAADHLRDSQAGKRVQPGESQPAEYTIDPKSLEGEAIHDLVLDVREAVAKLPPHLLAVAERLAGGDSITEAARELGVSRATVHARINLIRKRFERKELEKYLRPVFDSLETNRVVT